MAVTLLHSAMYTGAFVQSGSWYRVGGSVPASPSKRSSPCRAPLVNVSDSSLVLAPTRLDRQGTAVLLGSHLTRRNQLHSRNFDGIPSVCLPLL